MCQEIRERDGNEDVPEHCGGLGVSRGEEGTERGRE